MEQEARRKKRHLGQEGTQEDDEEESESEEPGKKRSKTAEENARKIKRDEKEAKENIAKKRKEKYEREERKIVNRRKETTYMDDRTSVAKDPEALCKGVKAWIQWSNFAFQIENKSKLQLTARTQDGKKRLAIEAKKQGLE